MKRKKVRKSPTRTQQAPGEDDKAAANFKRGSTFYQSKRKPKSEAKLNENDLEVVKQLKERLINYMHLNAE